MSWQEVIYGIATLVFSGFALWAMNRRSNSLLDIDTPMSKDMGFLYRSKHKRNRGL